MNEIRNGERTWSGIATVRSGLKPTAARPIQTTISSKLCQIALQFPQS